MPPGMNYLYMKPKEGRISWVCGLGLFADTENYHHAHEYVDSWASKEAAEFLLAYYYYGHTNTDGRPVGRARGRAEALGLDDPTVLDEPNAHPESLHPAARASTSSTGARCRRRDAGHLAAR